MTNELQTEKQEMQVTEGTGGGNTRTFDTRKWLQRALATAETMAPADTARAAPCPARGSIALAGTAGGDLFRRHALTADEPERGSRR